MMSRRMVLLDSSIFCASVESPTARAALSSSPMSSSSRLVALRTRQAGVLDEKAKWIFNEIGVTRRN